MKKLFVFALIFILCASLLSGCMLTFPSFMSYHYDNADRYTPGGGSLSGTVNKIEIGWLNGSVTVKPHSGDTVTFSEESRRTLSDGLTLHYLLEGTTLHIQFCRSGQHNISSLSKDLTVLIPEDIELTDIEIESVSADISAENISAKEIKLEAVSGDVLLSCCTAGEVDIETVSGSVKAQSVDTSAFSADTTSGSVTLSSASAPGELDIETVSGQITLSLPEEAGFTMKFDTVSGAFSSELPYSQDGKRFIFGSGTGDYKIDTTSGNVKIKAF